MAFNSEARLGFPHALIKDFGVGPYVLRKLLGRLMRGRLTVITPSGERLEHQGAIPGSEAMLVLHRWRALRKLLVGGDLGFAEAFVAGDWSSPDLTALLALGGENIEEFEQLIAGKLPARILRRATHLFNRNTKAASRRNIAFHYDLGNAFYRLWLDKSMTYSAALYRDPAVSLEQAQDDKLARIVAMLDLQGGEKTLEIGCGWGALAARLAERGAHVTGLTLSREQQIYAQTLIRDRQVDDRVDIRLEDYRDTQGSFDRIVSIEMLEAVGEAFWPTYFATLRNRLRPGGTAVLQVITIDETRFESYRHGADFIQRYIFPGGMLPTKTVIADQARRTGLTLSSQESFGHGYMLTLAEWRRRFAAAWPSIEKLGFDAHFRRLWEYYLCYCEAGFRTGLLDVGLYRLQR